MIETYKLVNVHYDKDFGNSVNLWTDDSLRNTPGGNSKKYVHKVQNWTFANTVLM